ncbi:MAG: terminase small subunit [Hyphomicrobiales bacterium]|nr:terminase small subunit [Hyphomicrobiales bacterium]
MGKGGKRPGAGRPRGSKDKLTREEKEIRAAAKQRAIDGLGITEKDVLQEIARLAFSDVRRVVSWRPERQIVAKPDDESGEGEPVKVIMSRVTVLDSATLADNDAAAIAEVAQGANGSLRIKMHDKGAALERLGRHLGLFKDRLEHTGGDGKPIQHEHVGAATAAKVKDELREIFGNLVPGPPPDASGAKHKVVRRRSRKGG